jgi:hypothetical protein
MVAHGTRRGQPVESGAAATDPVRMHRTRLSPNWFLAWFLAASAAAQGGTAPAPLTHSFTGTVTGMAADGKEPVRLTLWLHDYNRSAATIVSDVRAGEGGSFAFRGVPWLRAHDWGFAFFVLIARQGDRCAVSYLRGDDAARAPLSVALAPTITLRGTVRDDGGKPIAGAMVALAGLMRGEGDQRSYCFFAETPPQWQMHSGVDGAFAIAGVPSSWSGCVSVLHERWEARRIDQPADQPYDFALTPGAVLAGRVLDAGSRPCVRMRVCAQGIHSSAWRTAFTDDQGCYRLGSLPPDAFNVWIDCEDRTCAALASVGARAGEETKCEDLIAIEGGFLVGAVIDDATGKPVQPGTTGDVAIYGPSRPRTGGGCDCSPVQADGTFEIRVAPGSNHIYLRAGDGWEAVGAGALDVDVAAGGRTKVEFRVRRPAGK